MCPLSLFRTSLVMKFMSLSLLLRQCGDNSGRIYRGTKNPLHILQVINHLMCDKVLSLRVTCNNFQNTFTHFIAFCAVNTSATDTATGMSRRERRVFNGHCWLLFSLVLYVWQKDDDAGEEVIL